MFLCSSQQVKREAEGTSKQMPVWGMPVQQCCVCMSASCLLTHPPGPARTFPQQSSAGQGDIGTRNALRDGGLWLVFFGSFSAGLSALETETWSPCAACCRCQHLPSRGSLGDGWASRRGHLPTPAPPQLLGCGGLRLSQFASFKGDQPRWGLCGFLLLTTFG